MSRDFMLLPNKLSITWQPKGGNYDTARWGPQVTLSPRINRKLYNVNKIITACSGDHWRQTATWQVSAGKLLNFHQEHGEFVAFCLGLLHPSAAMYTPQRPHLAKQVVEISCSILATGGGSLDLEQGRCPFLGVLVARSTSEVRGRASGCA